MLKYRVAYRFALLRGMPAVHEQSYAVFKYLTTPLDSSSTQKSLPLRDEIAHFVFLTHYVFLVFSESQSPPQRLCQIPPHWCNLRPTEGEDLQPDLETSLRSLAMYSLISRATLWVNPAFSHTLMLQVVKGTLQDTKNPFSQVRISKFRVPRSFSPLKKVPWSGGPLHGQRSEGEDHGVKVVKPEAWKRLCKPQSPRPHPAKWCPE